MSCKTVIPIFFACDDRFIKYTMVAIKSLIVHSSKEYIYHLHILNTGIHTELQEKVMRLQEENVRIYFDDVSEHMHSMEEKLPIRDYYSMTTYYRLFLAEMFPQYEKAIYIDSDTVILGDVAEMYQHDLSGYYVGAVKDQVILQSDTFSEYVEQVLGMPFDTYFNAGVLLINCDIFRKDRVLEQFIELVNKYTFVVAQDQDYLNLICQDKVLWLEPQWNTEVFGIIPCDESTMKLIHYNMAAKPWHYKECRLSEYFWKYASMTEVYDDIKYSLDNYTEEERERDRISGERLLEMAMEEINNENNYYKMGKKLEGKSENRLKILDKIAQFEREGRFDEDVEDDPPTRELQPDEVDYMRKGIMSKLRTKYAFSIARWFLNTQIKHRQLIIKEIRGIENYCKLKSGAIITCNHFSAFDSFAMQVAYDKSHHRRRKLFRVIREGNYTNFPGFYGFLMRNCNTLPLSSNYKTMKKFISSVDQLLQDGHFVLIYPEQSMWWNYRKPKPLKKGSYTFAVKNHVPVLPCFITMSDSDVLDQDGFNVQEYTIHISKPIYPDPSKNRADNVEYMMKENYEEWKRIYEETYHTPLRYTCSETYLDEDTEYRMRKNS